VSCKICSRNLKCEQDGITTLKRHSNSRKHRDNIAAVKIQKEDRSDLLKMSEEISSVTIRARKIEILVSLFIAKHDLAVSLSDDLIRFLKKIDIDPAVQKELSCGSSKCTAIITNVTGKFTLNQLVSTLQRKKFALLIDESTDISTKESLAVVVRYRGNDFVVRDQFLTL